MPPTERDHAALGDAVASGCVQAQTGIGPSLHPEPDFSGSLEKIVLGAARGIVLSPGERERTAFHESGHALLGMLTPGADPVRKISIIPRGQALGVTYQAPEADRYGYSETYLRGRITGTLGGRAAEEVIYGDVTTGAENDMEHASAIARQMVGRRGMSPAIGPVSVLPSSGQESSTGTDGVAPATKELIDTETRRIIGECYQQAVETLRGSRDRLDRLAHTLLDRETLDEDEAYAAAGISPDTAPATGARAAARLVTARTPPVRKNLLPNGRGFTPRPGADTSAWPGGPMACSASGLLSFWPAGRGGMPRVRVRAVGAATPAWPRGRSGRPRTPRRWRRARSAPAGR